MYFFVSKLPLTLVGTDATKQMIFYKYLLAQEYRDLNFFWSWAYGLGGDLFAQFNYYYSTSFFFLLSLFFKIETLQDVVAMNLPFSVLRVFLAMVFVYGLLQYDKRSWAASMLGGIMYGGSMTFALNLQQFDFMVDAFVWLPLLIWAFHYYLKTKKPYFFIATFSLILISNFYFAFIATLYFILYATYKYFEQTPKSIRGFGLYAGKLALCYTAAVGIAAFSFLPAVYQFLSSDRLTKEYDIPLLFNSSFYEKVPQLLFMSFHGTYSIGMAVLMLFLLATGLFIKNKELLPRKVFVSCIFFFFCIPMMYSVFNGFSAMQNRWYYLIAFTGSIVASSFFDELAERKRLWRPFMIVAIVFLIYMAFRWPHRSELENSFDFKLLLLGVVGAIAFVLYRRAKWRIAMTTIILISVVLSGSVQYTAYFTAVNKDLTAEDFNSFFDKVGYGHYEGLQVSNAIKREQQEFSRTIWDSPKMEQNSGM